MSQTPPNPYIDLHLGELNKVMQARAGSLLRGEPVGRRDIAYLLIAAGSKLDPRPADMSGPVYRARNQQESLGEAFLDFYESEARSLRYWVIRRALDQVEGIEAGSGLDVWLNTALGSEEGLRACLQRLSRYPLEALWEGQVVPGRPAPDPVPD